MTFLLKPVLGLAGLAIMALGLNVALGGFATLELQGPSDFFAITDPEIFAVQDNHVRFIAGVWFGVGLMFVAGAFAMQHLRTVLLALIVMIFVGGLARLSAMDFELLTSAAILPSLLAELILFPLLGWWIMRIPEGQDV